MSSFIVSQECMNNIINGLFWTHDFKHYGNFLERHGYNQSEDFQKLGDKLYALNHLAVASRYDEEKQETKFIWRSSPAPDKFQVLKSMHCLHYQCSEEKADRTKLYRFLTELINSWKDFIIATMSEYDKAKWD